MSIRLRFTLLYSFILAFTLAIFGIALYSIQAQYTLNALKRELQTSSNAVTQSLLRVPPPKPGVSETEPVNPPVPFRDFSNDTLFLHLPEREIARVLDASGNLIASPFGVSADALPLSEKGLETVQAHQDWFEEAAVENLPLLILNHPVMEGDSIIFILQVARPLSERNNSLNSLATTLAIAGVITTLAAFGIGWILAGVTLQPIHRITQTAQSIGKERDFTRRVNHSGPPDEIGQLATTFNTMLASLQEAYQRIEQSLEMQRNFVADVSHELRTPLTTLRGNLGLLQHTPPLPETEQQDILKDMESESDRLIHLVNELLVLARADAGHSLSNENFTLLQVVENACKQVHVLDPQRLIDIRINSDLTLVGDRDVFKQIILALLDNSIKYTKKSIQVTAESSAEQIQLIVQDHGSGISAETLEHVFDRFYRSEDTLGVNGFGLGLPIAKALVESQGGQITLESEPGIGSKVILQFPVTK